MLLLLTVVVGVAWSERIGCRPTEFRCSSGQCVDGGRYCDGNADCFDASDEPDRCTNCNRTFFGVTDVKYPLRLSERRSPTCTLSFVAAGGKYGDRIEITFLSFQIGTFDFDSSTCLKGYMEMEESQPSDRRRERRRTKKKGPRKGASLQAPAGSFCGPLTGQSATFYSSGERVRLSVFVPPAAGQPIVPRLYLTYRFLQQHTRHDSTCHQTLTDCNHTDCVIRSPNFPGFYLRNISCHYRIREDSSNAQIEVFQENEFKIKIPSGHTNSDRYKPGTLTSDCAGDTVRIYDGATAEAPLLAAFCGAGPLPPVRSSGPSLLVTLTSVPFRPLATSHFELAVRVRPVERGGDGCSVTVDGGARPSGVLRAPDHSVPAGTVCTYRVTARRPTDRVWLYFASFHVPDLNPWSEDERCDVAKMEVVVPRRRHAHHHRESGDRWAETFCEKRSPRQCGHASDFSDLVPSRPCTLPEESYLSPGPEILLRMSYSSAHSSIRGTPHFAARYEVVEGGAEDSCAFVLDSRDRPSGVLESPRNVFLYGRGGAKDLYCKWELRGSSEERVRISVTEVRFPPLLCKTSFDPVTQKHSCSVFSFGKFAALNASELWQGQRVFVGCACDAGPKGIVLESVGGAVDLEFLVRAMGPRDDSSTFRFRLSYEFVPRAAACDVTGAPVLSGSRGRVALLRAGAAGALRCRWMLAALPARALYVTVSGRPYDADECENKILFYNVNDWEPYSVFCPSDDGHTESFFTEAWRRPFEPDLTFLEYLVNEEGGSLEVNWMEVSRTTPCPLECPELEACIGEELACDGVRHCPISGTDEAPERCDHTPFLAVAISSTAAVAVVTLVALAALLRHRAAQRGKGSPVPPPPLAKNKIPCR